MPSTQSVTLDQIRQLPEPLVLGRRHVPHPHMEVLERLEKAAKVNDLVVDVAGGDWHIVPPSPAFLTKYGDEAAANNCLIGTCDVRPANGGLVPVAPDYTFKVVIRHDNAMRISMQIGVGVNVSFCTNLCVWADMQLVKMKHTAGLNLLALLVGGFEEWMSRAALMNGAIDDLKHRQLSDLEAKGRLFDLFTQKNPLPLTFARPVAEQYFAPVEQTQELAPRNEWGLLMAVTRQLRELPADRKLKYTSVACQAFGLGKSEPEESEEESGSLLLD